MTKRSQDTHISHHSSWPLWLVIHAFVLAILVSFAYRHAIHGGYIFDDEASITNNPSLQPEAGLRGMFSPFENATTGGRPILNASFAVNMRVWGAAPTSFRVVNIIIHVINGTLLALVCFIVIRTGKWGDGAGAFLIAAFASLVWTLHPLQINAVTYIVQRAESLASLFYLAAFLAAFQFLNGRGRWVSFVLAGVFTLIAGLTKEIAATLPLTLTVVHYFVSRRLDRDCFGRSWLMVMALCAVMLLPVVALTLADTRMGTAGFGYEKVTEWDYFRAQHSVFFHYIKGMIWPNPLSLDYGWPHPSSDFSENVCSVLYLVVFIVAMVAFFRSYTAALALLGFWIIILPTSSIIPINDFAFDHRCYLASAWFACAASCFGAKILNAPAIVSIQQKQLMRKFGIGLAALASVALGVGTTQRNRAYADPVTIWSETARKRPNNPRPLNNLGVLFAQSGRRAEAYAAFSEAIRLKPDYAYAWNNLGLEMAHLNRVEEARDCFAKAAHFEPLYHNAFNNLGTMFLDLGQPAEAVRAFREASRIRPEIPDYHQKLAIALQMNGQISESQEEAAKARELLRKGSP